PWGRRIPRVAHVRRRRPADNRPDDGGYRDLSQPGAGTGAPARVVRDRVRDRTPPAHSGAAGFREAAGKPRDDRLRGGASGAGEAKGTAPSSKDALYIDKRRSAHHHIPRADTSKPAAAT